MRALTWVLGSLAVAASAAAAVYVAKPDVFATFVEPAPQQSQPAATGPATSKLEGQAAKGEASGRPQGQTQGQTIGQSQGRRDAGGPTTVEVANARQDKASGDIRAVGSLQSDEAVQIASEIAGRISKIPFEEGQPVKAGSIIVQLDEALVRAEVSDAKARLALATANNDRARTLARTGTVTGRTRDEALSNFETANAAVELAETRLSKHTLVAPFDGVAGVRSVSVGAFVAIGAPIVNIEKIDTLKVDFKVPEIHLSTIKVGQQIEVSVDAIANKTFAGEIYAINPLVDVNGRSLEIRARLPNVGMELRPGLFARIVIKGMSSRDVTLVPESALVPRGEETFVYRVDNGKAVEAAVKLGARQNAEVEIIEGLEPSATVVVAGQQKLRNGSAIEVIEGAQPRAPANANGRSG